MKKSILTLFILIVLAALTAGCASERKHQSVLRGLMLQENTELGRNRAYYSKFNIKTKKAAYRKYHKNSSYKRHKKFR
ncbi:MAG: hypothetical protein IQL11_15260 [Bacteroidales bacterium]|nr:hypothetical protein [Bacteroidales bacterium]